MTVKMRLPWIERRDTVSKKRGERADAGYFSHVIMIMLGTEVQNSLLIFVQYNNYNGI